MKKNILIILFALSIISCKETLKERHYKSMDVATGGFTDYSLDLNTNGSLLLSLTFSKIIDEDSTQFVENLPTKSVTGKWILKNNEIMCKFNDSKSVLDSIFFDIETRKENTKKQIVTFSKKLDTAFIYEIPCILIDKNKLKKQ